MKRKHIPILASFSLVFVAILLIGVLVIPRSIRNFFYPAAPTMPPVVGQSMADILGTLEGVMQLKAPKVLAELRPGLSQSDVNELEHKSGIILPDDLRALYRWHNGSGSRDPMFCGLIPGHRFLPLDEALGAISATANQLTKANSVQQTAYNVFAGHTKSWIPLFDDGAGDGYFFDPKRQPSEGPVFYHFAEDASYVFFPSVKNLLSGTVKCYEQGALVWKTNESGIGLIEDFERSQKLWQEFGASNNVR
jgi:cell wall assembly regulator SMI1